MRSQITKLEMRLLRRRQWLVIDTPETSPESMLEAYLADERLTCCSIQGGLFIDVDGKPWSDDSTVDEFRMTQVWFGAMAELLSGATSTEAGWGPWEESALAWTRTGDDVTMVDGRATPMMWSVTVDLPSLARAVAECGRAFARWARDIRLLAQVDHPGRRHQAKTILENLPDEDDLAQIDALVERVRQ